MADGKTVQVGVVERHQNATVNRSGFVSAPAVSGSITGARPSSLRRVIKGSSVTHASSASKPALTSEAIRSTSGRHAPAAAAQSATAPHANLMFNPTMTAAAVHARHRTQVLFANEPMRARSLVKWISGITANGSCMLRITWLRMSRPKVELVAGEIDGQRGRYDGQGARDQAAQPRPHAKV